MYINDSDIENLKIHCIENADGLINDLRTAGLGDGLENHIHRFIDTLSDNIGRLVGLKNKGFSSIEKANNKLYVHLNELDLIISDSREFIKKDRKFMAGIAETPEAKKQAGRNILESMEGKMEHLYKIANVETAWEKGRKKPITMTELLNKKSYINRVSRSRSPGTYLN